MPKIISYTPGWLSRPSPGHEVFTAKETRNISGVSGKGYSDATKANVKPGPKRTIARRGTEVFVAVGKEIRWAELVNLKESWEENQERQRGAPKGQQTEEDFGEEEEIQEYRIIKTTVADDIKQLIISPLANYLAILTTHTVHISLLPDRSHLAARESGPMRLKTFTLGPTTHVTTQSAIISALWHPLGVNGTCLVTVTEEAVVRVWELSTTDRWSFDRPTLTIDLKKLADGTSLDQDFAATVGANKSFSPDSFEMEVASTCFGGRGSGDWSPMTLWVAMKEGDVYALCPLLPEKWAPPPTLIPSLSISIVAKVASLEDDFETSEQARRLSQQQLAWMSDLDNQEPLITEVPLGEPPIEIYSRPLKPGSVPKLQGPFLFELSPEESDDELDAMLSDIYVIGANVDVDALMSGEEDEFEMDEATQEGLAASVVCLLSCSGRVSVCLDLDGVEAQWLPSRRSKQLLLHEVSDPPSLLVFQAMDTLRTEEVYEDNWPMFSHDINSRYSFFVTNQYSITFISLTPWIFRLDKELQQSESSDGLDFRLGLLVKSQSSTRERLITQEVGSEDHAPSLAASVVFHNSDLGYFLLSATSHGPTALTFETPEVEEIDARQSRSRSPTYDYEPEPQPLLFYTPRPVYEPSYAFSSNSALPAFLENLRRSKYKRLAQEPVRLSPASLTIFTDAHKVLSEETHRLGTAAAELFRRCEQLQVELREQIHRANEVASRVEHVIGADTDFGEGAASGNEAMIERIEIARVRQQDLMDRLEKIRKKTGKGTGKELSDKEKVWVEEVATFSSSIMPPKDNSRNSDDEHSEPSTSQVWQRYEEVQALKDDLVRRLTQVTIVDGEKAGEDIKDVKVPSVVRRDKVAQVMTLLEREGALVDGARSRLEKLNLS